MQPFLFNPLPDALSGIKSESRAGKRAGLASVRPGLRARRLRCPAVYLASVWPCKFIPSSLLPSLHGAVDLGRKPGKTFLVQVSAIPIQ